MASGEILLEEIPPLNGSKGWFSWLPSWKPTSEALLEEAEKAVLSTLTSNYKDTFIPIGPNAVLRTAVLEPTDSTEPEGLPLVMIPGFGGGFVQYYKNLDHLHANRKVYAFDLPGFGRSTRVAFSADAEKAEEEFVAAIETWREEMGLEKFIFLGHSLGAFLACAYAMKYPSRVRHLILVDPWGFPIYADRQGDKKMPFWAVLATSLLTVFNPLTPVRWAGPFGPFLINIFRPDLARKFSEPFMDYVYHCNAQNPTGETAFFYMQIPFGWARRPMLERVGSELDSSIPITFLHGVRSWMDNRTGEQARECRPDSYTDVHYVRRAGHHVHAEQPQIFNKIVNETCAKVDANRDCSSDAQDGAEDLSSL